ncbi:methyltransferase domain-containing protein [Streptomyces blastmyceticus]|uniref:Methyltransferase domain-containing protein n=2 Tax=Streptomyces blastmyceticus TaxID=68180 RepID=A0ABN0Y168_9ACTN
MVRAPPLPSVTAMNGNHTQSAPTAPASAAAEPPPPGRKSGALALRPFLREASRTMRTTGAIAPSSSRLGAGLAAPLPASGTRGPVRVLEVGAGTGTVTRVLAGRLGPGDRLEAVEVNPRFVRLLLAALRSDPVMAAASERIRIVPQSITELPLAEHGYDMIVSCLPFTNFEPDLVRSLLERYLTALVPGGHLTYFGYLGTQATRTLVSSRAETARHRAVAAVLAEFSARYGSGGGHRVVWRNLPPARVHHLRSPERCAVPRGAFGEENVLYGPAGAREPAERSAPRW